MTRVRRIGRATFASLHNRNYRLYFTGQIISVSGTWMQRLAQAWLVLSLTNNNGVWLGVETGLTAARTLEDLPAGSAGRNAPNLVYVAYPIEAKTSMALVPNPPAVPLGWKQVGVLGQAAIFLPR